MHVVNTKKSATEAAVGNTSGNGVMPGPSDHDGLPIKMLNDRILVRTDTEEGERRSTGGILIPATAQMGKRLTWAEVVAVGPNVRAMEVADRVLFNPEDRYEVEVRGIDYIISSDDKGYFSSLKFRVHIIQIK